MNGSDPKSRDQSEERRFRAQRERDRRETERSLNDSDSNMSGSQEVLPVNSGDANMYMMGSVDSVMMNMFMNPFMGMNIVPPMLTSGDPPIIMNPVKEIIHCKSCTLFPPNPHAPAPTTRERPPGCRTVFVGGLPEKISEEIIHEIFERCGEISTLRLSKKNFCHIRFVFESSVDAAIFLSGYRVRIGSNIDAGHTGRLHVDYAQARDDQYEWECRQRQLQREQRHRERMEEERLKRSSPPPVIHYTDHEASNVAEKIKQDDTFTKAVQIVITWLERGDCNKKNANNFYSMIQSTNSHVRRLLNEKSHYEEELKKAKDLLKGRMQGILLQFSHIERLFTAAHHKKVWDHFTKAQRKNIEAWKKQSLEIKNFQLEDIQEKPRDDDEMDVSDDDEPIKKKPRDASTEERNNLKDENDSLKCQVEAYKNEVEVIKMDYKKDLDDKEKQFKMLQQTLQGMQQQLMEAKRKQLEEEQKVKELETKLKVDRAAKISEVITLDDDDVEQSDSDSVTEVSSNSRPGGTSVSDSDAKLIGVISTFLNVHPFGASLDYIWSYVSKIEPNLRPADIESLMNRFPSVFKQELVGIGANIERKWIFNAFHIVQRYNSSNKSKENND
ncbi:ecto-NOX disulfide-thiol exchanger 1 isoform X2 [Rhynchophorus ferrugineus]